MHEAPQAQATTPTWKQVLVDIGERVGSTFIQTFLSTLVVTTAVVGPVVTGRTRTDWLGALGVAATAAVVALLTSVVRWLVRMLDSGTLLNPYLDLVYRTVMTFAQTLLGYVTMAGPVPLFKFDWNTALAASLVAAGTALAKAAVGLHAPTLGAAVLTKAA
jgi:hypothetical protein